MNERFEQLLDQAQALAREQVKNTPEFAKYAPSYAIPGTEIHVGLRLSYQKFAELIVRECLEACSRANEIRHFVPPGQQQVVLDCMREIETTFRS